VRKELSHRIEPELVEVIEEIISRRIKEELKERAQLVTVDQFAEAMDRIDRRFDVMQAEMDRRFEESNQRFDRLENMVSENSQILKSLQS